MSDKFDKTMQFKLNSQEENRLVEILKNVHDALKEKGYDPSNQIIGYLLSGDPTYITSHKDARKQIKQIDRNELLEDILQFYFNENNIK